MILPILLGIGWGLAASGVHYLLLRRTIERRRVTAGKPNSITVQISSLLRMLVVGGFLVVGLGWGRIHVKVAVLAYAISSLVVIMVYGIRLSMGAIQPEALHKESGR